MTTPIALLRHGRTAWNRAHRLQGRADMPLDAEGCAEVAARRLAPPWTAARIVSSPLRRASETAALLAEGRPVETDPRLVEMDFGAWEGRAGRDLDADPTSGFLPIERWGWSFRPPGGESVAEVRARVSPALHDLAAHGRPTLLVSHIGVMRVILAMAHGWDFAGPPPFRVKRFRLFVVDIDAQGALTPWPEPVALPERAAAGAPPP